MRIKIAKNDSEVVNCFETMSQLRVNLKKENFLSQIRRQEKFGYMLLYIENNKKVISVAGFRICENLAWKKFIYIDDLITDNNYRSKGYGDKLIKWLVNYAKKNKCHAIHLDSGVQRFDAHRFYLKNKFKISSHHFSLIF